MENLIFFFFFSIETGVTETAYIISAVSSTSGNFSVYIHVSVHVLLTKKNNNNLQQKKNPISLSSVLLFYFPAGAHSVAILALPRLCTTVRTEYIY